MFLSLIFSIKVHLTLNCGFYIGKFKSVEIIPINFYIFQYVSNNELLKFEWAVLFYIICQR